MDAHLALVAVVELQAADLLPQPQRHAVAAQVEGQPVHDLGIDERQQARPLVDEGHAHAQRGEHARVLQADDPGTDDGQAARQPVERDRVVAGEDAPAVEGDVVVARHGGAGGDHDVAAAEGLAAVATGLVDHDRVRVEERPVTRVQVHAVAHELVAHDVGLVPHHLVGAEAQVVDADVLLDRVRRPVEAPLAVAAEGHGRLAEGLEGIVPVATHTPPTAGARSITATRFPSLAAWMAARWPPGPDPIAIRS
jgi:hypothetical protein